MSVESDSNSDSNSYALNRRIAIHNYGHWREQRRHKPSNVNMCTCRSQPEYVTPPQITGARVCTCVPLRASLPTSPAANSNQHVPVEGIFSRPKPAGKSKAAPGSKGRSKKVVGSKKKPRAKAVKKLSHGRKGRRSERVRNRRGSSNDAERCPVHGVPIKK